MATIVKKWGDSLAVRIPKSVAKRMKLNVGSQVEFDERSSILIIRPKYRRKHTLAKLLAGYNPTST